MIQCPKCGGREIDGPKYREPSPLKEECLVYYCLQCGYSQISPTLDQKRVNGLPDIEKLIRKTEGRDEREGRS